MNKVELIKNELTPVIVVTHYLGSAEKKTGSLYWYKSPFRNERTASFCVSNEKGIHDFGTGEHFDVISFVQRLYNVDFKTTLNKICSDFGIYFVEENKELKSYLLDRAKEEKEIREKIDKWFNKTFSRICDEIKNWEKISQYANTETTRLVKEKLNKLDKLSNEFITASTDNDKYELWKKRDEINQCIR